MKRLLPILLLFSLVGGISCYLYFPTPGDTFEPPPPPFVDNHAELPPTDKLAEILRADPIAALEACLQRYNREVIAYRATMIKQERIDTTLLGREVIRATVREKPSFAVLMQWSEGGRGSKVSLYVEGEYTDPSDGKSYLHIRGPLGNKRAIDPDGYFARSASRYRITESSIGKGMLRTFTDWSAAHRAGLLRVAMLPEQTHSDTGNRPCYVLRRTVDPPEKDGLTQATIWIDKETWLLVGTELYAGEKLLGRYFFRDVVLNPPIDPKVFKLENLP